MVRRPAPLSLIAFALVAVAPALAFFSGGYFEGPRLVAAIATWALAAAAVLAAPDLRALRGVAAVALAALAALSAWTALSITWAPLDQPAVDALERVLLYLAACAAAVLLFADRERARWLAPVTALGVLVVIGYGVLARMLPDIVEVTKTITAGGRLDQPLTYWNAEGALAAMGLVLCLHLAGDRTRPDALRAAASAAAVPLGLGVYLTFSRGVLSALAVGLLVLAVLAPTWAQLRAGALALEAAVLASVAASLLPAVQAGEGEGWTGQGLVMLAACLALMALAAAMQAHVARAERGAAVRVGPLPAARVVRRLAAAGAVLSFCAPFAAGAISGSEAKPDPAFGATAERLGSLDSDRYGYWEVALATFADDPLTGIGAGGFRVAWLRERDVPDPARDAHSVELEHLAQLGIVGLGLLLAAFGAVAVAARRVARADVALGAGPAAALAVWFAHSAIDWDWQMPALTLVACVLAGGLLGRAQAGPELGEQDPLAA